MILKVGPTRFLQGKVRLPASKSYSIRAFLIASCGGNSRIIHPSDCDDAKAAISISKQLGSQIFHSKKDVWEVRAGKKQIQSSYLNVRESGTVLRFLLPLLPLCHRKVSVTGEGTLRGRPNTHLIKTLRTQGVLVKGRGAKGTVPIIFSGGRLRGGKMSIDGSLSSQFISALLIACPQLEENTQLIIRGKTLVSSDYITMTQKVLQKAGIKVAKVNNRLYKIRGQQRFRGLGTFAVPSDYGLAAFLLGAGALSKSRLILEGAWDDSWPQADGKILLFLRRMGVRFSKSNSALKINGPFSLKGGTFSLKNCPDLVPIMAVLALFAKGQTRLKDIRHARAKESDRISDLRKELLKIGASVAETENDLTIQPLVQYKRDVLLDPHHDHRLAMAFSVLGLKLGVRIKDIECVSKSYPRFVRDFRNLQNPR
jgi:3-phosphoshikimate 1-carboxyvinyltransferase